MDEDQLKKYFKWLDAGKSPSDIKKDLINNGLSDKDAHTLMARIDSLFLGSKIQGRGIEHIEPQDGRLYRIAGWIVVVLSIVFSVISFLYASVFGGWFVIIGGGGGGFGLIRYSYKIESKNFFKRNKGFRRRFEY